MKCEEETETITLKIPLQVIEFADFYATITEMDREELLSKIIIERLSEIRKKLREVPHMTSEVIWSEWDVS